MIYVPRPIDTAGVQPSREILELTELLARNNYDIWAQKRSAEGWTCGPRNDALKQNPCSLPCEELPDSRKKYDRQTAIQTLKTIVALGQKPVIVGDRTLE